VACTSTRAQPTQKNDLLLLLLLLFLLLLLR
jgi:MYXO-CTERM domain-containing protein